MSILERLYDGKVYPCEEILPQNYAEYRAISGQVGNDYEYFLKELSPEQLKRFEEMDKGRTKLSLYKPTPTLSTVSSWVQC